MGISLGNLNPTAIAKDFTMNKAKDALKDQLTDGKMIGTLSDAFSKAGSEKTKSSMEKIKATMPNVKEMVAKLAPAIFIGTSFIK